MAKDIIKLYDPANAGNLTPDEITAMQNLSKAELDQLAAAYPNKTLGGSYLVLFNKSIPANKQLYPLTTWQNLANLRRNPKKDNFVAFNYAKNFNRKSAKATGLLPSKGVQDLTKQAAEKEAESLAPNGGAEKEVSKDYSKMELKDLKAEYQKVFGEAPTKGATKKQLITQLVAAKN